MTALLIASCLTPVLFIFIQKRKGGALATVGKTLASVCFVSLGLGTFASGTGSRAGLLVILGLVFGLCGDILLDVGFEADGTPNDRVIGGIAAFAFEHIAVVMAVCKTVGFDFLSFLAAIAIGFVLGLGVCLTEKKRFRFQYGSLWVPASVYAVFLSSAMVYYVIVALSDPSFWIMVAGMAFFLISDLILSFIYFGNKNIHAWVAVNLLTYYAGQIFFALAIPSAFC